MVIPDKYDSFPEDEGTNCETKYSPNSSLDPTAWNTQNDSNEGNHSLANVEPRLNNHELVLVHRVQGIKLVVVFIEMKEIVVYSALESMRPIKHEECVNADNDVTDKDPEQGWFGNDHNIFNLL